MISNSIFPLIPAMHEMLRGVLGFQSFQSLNDTNDNVFDDSLPSPPPGECSASGSNSDDELDEYNSHRYWYIPPPDIIDLANSNSEPEDDEKKRTSSCDSTIIVTSDNEILDLIDSDWESQRPDRSELMNPALFEGETEWSLIEDFVHMKNIDADMLYQCAYYFPAVLFTFGGRFWPIFQPHFTELCYNFQVSVRKTVAASISQVALIIGREYATRDLVAPFMDFFFDNVEIKMGVLKNLSTFIKVVEPSEHPKILNQFNRCLNPSAKGGANWRFREALGIQLLKLIEMHEQINQSHCILYLIAISYKLMEDQYDCVRKIGVEAFIEGFRKAEEKEQLLKFFRDHFAYNVNWKRKQLYILTVDKMVRPLVEFFF